MESPLLATSPEDEDESAKLIIRACDACRRKKIRCEVMGDSCAQCIKYKTHCHFTPVKIKRNPRRPPGYKHIENLEERLKRMEAMLQGQVSIQSAEDDTESEHQTGSRNVGGKRKASHPLKHPPGSGQAQKRKRKQNRRASIRSNSSSSQLGEEQIPESSQDRPAHLGNDSPISVPYWRFTISTDIFARHKFKQLPPKDEARLLIQEMFQTFNTAFPIFDKASFLNDFEARYADDNHDDPSWWACLNVVFTLAHRFRAMKTQNQSEDSHAWGYLQNALAAITELTTMKPELATVQAILGVAMVLQGTPNLQLCSVLVSTALRLAHTMKLHRRDLKSGFSAVEFEQRKKVFWIAYIVDKDISLRTGDPPAQDDDDMDVELPAETVDLSSVIINDVNLFNLHIGLAIIQGQIYKRLSSIKALRYSEMERSLAAKELDAMLASWKQGVPSEFASYDSSTSLGGSNSPTLLHTIILKLTYFSALNTIHHSLFIGSHLHIKSIEPIGKPQSPKLSLLNDPICLEEARNSMQLLLMLPQGDFACVWLLIHHIFCASTTVLLHVISNSVYTLAENDLELVEPVLKLMKTLNEKEKDSDVGSMEESLTAMWKEAKAIVGDSIEGTTNDSDGGDTVEEKNCNTGKGIKSLEDFTTRIILLTKAACKGSNQASLVSE